MAGQTVTVSVLADTKPLASAFQSLGDKLGLGKLASGIGKVGKAVAIGAAAAGAGIGALAVKTVGMASDLEQSVGGVNAVFKDHADAVHQLAAGAAMDLGLTKTNYNELATVIGTTLKNSGTPMKELASTTDELIARSADLAATFGGPVTESSNAMASALRGEFEPLRRYGIALDQASINARAMADSGKTNAAELTKQEKALATQALIMEQSADAAGAFARENDTLAGKIERARAVAGNLGATLGEVLLPAATAAMGYLLERGVPAVEALGTWASTHLLPKLQALGTWFAAEGVPRLQEFGEFIGTTVVPKLREFGEFLGTTVLPKLQEFGTFLAGTVVPAIRDFGTWVMNNTAWLVPLAGAILGAVAGFRAFTIAMTAWKAITTLATTAQLLLNTALLANPIGLIIAAVAGLVAGLVILWNTNEGFREAVTTAWNAIKSAAVAVWGWLQTLPGKFMGMMSAVAGAVSSGVATVVGWFAGLPGRAAGALSTLASNIRNRATEAMTSLRTKVTEGLDRATELVRGLPGKAHSALAALASRIGQRGTEAMTRLRDRIRDGITRATELVRGLPGKAVSALGDLSGKLASAGRQLIGGFISGITSRIGDVRSSLGGLTSKLTSWKGPPKRDAKLLTPAGRLIIDGLVRGLQAGRRDVRRELGALTRELATTELPTLSTQVGLSPSLDVRARHGAIAAGQTTTPRQYHITLQTLDPTPEVGRLVVHAIRDYERMNGASW